MRKYDNIEEYYLCVALESRCHRFAEPPSEESVDAATAKAAAAAAAQAETEAAAAAAAAAATSPDDLDDLPPVAAKSAKAKAEAAAKAEAKALEEVNRLWTAAEEERAELEIEAEAAAGAARRARFEQAWLRREAATLTALANAHVPAPGSALAASPSSAAAAAAKDGAKDEAKDGAKADAKAGAKTKKSGSGAASGSALLERQPRAPPKLKAEAPAGAPFFFALQAPWKSPKGAVARVAAAMVANAYEGLKDAEMAYVRAILRRRGGAAAVAALPVTGETLEASDEFGGWEKPPALSDLEKEIDDLNAQVPLSVLIVKSFYKKNSRTFPHEYFDLTCTCGFSI